MNGITVFLLMAMIVASWSIAYVLGYVMGQAEEAMKQHQKWLDDRDRKGPTR
jgi:hypothetical protein